MYCDFAAVTDILLAHMIRSSIDNYKGLLESLFSAYLKNVNKVVFANQESSKFSTRVRIPPADFVDYYFIKNDGTLLLNDIGYIVTLILDKEHLHNILFKLLLKDELLSVAYRKRLVKQKMPEYTSDDELSDLIYECVRISLERPYFKGKGEKEYAVKTYFDPDSPLEKNIMFPEDNIIKPCKTFCCRKEALKEIHSILNDKTKLVLTGVAGVGKSELARAYIKKYKSNYANIGYYQYDGSLCSIISGMNSAITSLLDLDDKMIYKTNLETLTAFDKDTLIVIDNFYKGFDEEECLNDLLNLKCTVLITSRRKIPDAPCIELYGLINPPHCLEFFRQYYSYEKNDAAKIIGISHIVNFNPFFMQLCAALLQKNLYSPHDLLDILGKGDLSKITERISIRKDNRTVTNSFYQHTSDLLRLKDLPEQHKNALRMLISITNRYAKKDIAIKLLELDDKNIIEDLIDDGLLLESKDGSILMPIIVSCVVLADLKPDEENCRILIQNITSIISDERLSEKYGDISDFVIEFGNFNIIQPKEKAFYFIHDCFKYVKKHRKATDMAAIEFNEVFLCDRSDPKQLAVFNADGAAFALEKELYDKALQFQKSAVNLIKDTDATLLKAEIFSDYGDYLDMSGIGENVQPALEYMKQGIEYYDQLELDAGKMIEKCYVLCNYASLLHNTLQDKEALDTIYKAITILQGLDMCNTELYADCLYELGLSCIAIHNFTEASNVLYIAFSLYLRWHEMDSEFFIAKQSRAWEHAAFYNSDMFQKEPLCRLFPIEEDDDDDYADNDSDDYDDEEE